MDAAYRWTRTCGKTSTVQGKGLSKNASLGSVASSWGDLPNGPAYGMFQVEHDPPSRSASPFRQERILKTSPKSSIPLADARAEALKRARLGTSYAQFGDKTVHAAGIFEAEAYQQTLPCRASDLMTRETRQPGGPNEVHMPPTGRYSRDICSPSPRKTDILPFSVWSDDRHASGELSPSPSTTRKPTSNDWRAETAQPLRPPSIAINKGSRRWPSVHQSLDRRGSERTQASALVDISPQGRL